MLKQKSITIRQTTIRTAEVGSPIIFVSPCSLSASTRDWVCRATQWDIIDTGEKRRWIPSWNQRCNETSKVDGRQRLDYQCLDNLDTKIALYSRAALSVIFRRSTRKPGSHNLSQKISF